MPKHILIIDDSEPICEVIQLTMELDGYDTTVRNTGKDTCDFIAQLQPDLILLDIMLDGYDGRDICKLLKQTATTSHIPIIMVSASHELRDTVTSNCFPDDFVAKPFNIDVLSAAVRKQLSRANPVK